MRPTRSVTRGLLRISWALGLAAPLVLLSAMPGATAPMPSGLAWIDRPLAGSVHPLGEVVITAHATDPAGVSAIHVWIGDQVFHTAALDATPILASAEFAWTPPGTGSYLLTVRGVGLAGDWSLPALAIVTIDDDLEPAPTGEPSAPASTPASRAPGATPRPGSSPTPRPTVGPTPRATPDATPTPSLRATPKATPTASPTSAPTPTPRPSPTPCAPAPPILVAPANGTVIRDPSLNPPTFEWAYRTPPACPPTGYRIQVFDDPDLAHLVLDASLGAVSSWRPSAPLADCTTYFWRVAATGTTFGPWSDPSSVQLFIGRC